MSSHVGFIVHNSAGQILRTGRCPLDDLHYQAGDGEFVTEGRANDLTQKIVAGRIVDKDPAELEAARVAEYTERPAPENMPVMISQGQWDAVLRRLADLEAKLT